MSLVVGIIAKDGIVLAADSRMTSNKVFNNDTVRKIVRLNDNNAVGISGDGTLGLHILEMISENLNYEEGIISLVEQIRELGKNQFAKYYSNVAPENRPSLTLLVAGYSKKSTPKIYTLLSQDEFVPRPSSTGFNCIGVPYFADYLLNRFYQSEIDMKQAQVLAAFCVMETASHSTSVGGELKIASFSETVEYSELKLSEIDELKAKCSKFHLGNKNKFYPETPENLDNL